MKKTAILVTCSFLLFLIVPSFAVAQFNRSGDRVCVYRDNNFNGREECYSAGNEITDLRSSQISSIRVYGRARAVIYQDRDFRGESAQFSGDVPDLAQVAMPGSRQAWNDRVGSMRVVSDNGYGYPQQSTADVQEGVCVYDRPNYEGRSQCWASDMADLGRLNWSDRIQSIRIMGRTRVIAFRDINYQGERVTIDRDTPNLSRWGRQISSLSIQTQRGYGRRNRRYRY